MRSILALGLAAAPLAPLAVQAGETDGARHITVEEAMENTNEVYGVPPPEVDCGAKDSASNSGAIVVCGSRPEIPATVSNRPQSSIPSRRRRWTTGCPVHPISGHRPAYQA